MFFNGIIYFLFSSERDNVIKKAESMYQNKLNDIDKLSKERKETEKVLKKTEKSLHDTMIKVSKLIDRF